MLGRGFAWLDTGTHESLVNATMFIKTVEDRQDLKIACIEEIAFKNGWIDREQLKRLALPLEKSGYGSYLLRVADERHDVSGCDPGPPTNPMSTIPGIWLVGAKGMLGRQLALEFGARVRLFSPATRKWISAARKPAGFSRGQKDRLDGQLRRLHGGGPRRSRAGTGVGTSTPPASRTWPGWPPNWGQPDPFFQRLCFRRRPAGALPGKRSAPAAFAVRLEQMAGRDQAGGQSGRFFPFSHQLAVRRSWAQFCPYHASSSSGKKRRRAWSTTSSVLRPTPRPWPKISPG